MAQDSDETAPALPAAESLTASAVEEPTTDAVTPPDTPATPPVRTAGLPPQAQVRVTNLAANMSNRMEATINRMQNVINRMESRLDILDTQNIVTDIARTELAKAQTSIVNATTNLKTIDADVAKFVGSEDPRASWALLKNTYISSRDALLSAHSSLQKTLDAIATSISAPPPVVDETSSTSSQAEIITE